LNVDLRILNFVVSHKFLIKFTQLAYQAWKMRNAACGLILSLPIVHYFQIERIMANRPISKYIHKNMHINEP